MKVAVIVEFYSDLIQDVGVYKDLDKADKIYDNRVRCILLENGFIEEDQTYTEDEIDEVWDTYADNETMSTSRNISRS